MKARKSITRFTIVMALAVLAVGVFAGAAMAGTLTSLNWSVSNSQTATETVTYTYEFTTATSGDIKSVTMAVPTDTGGSPAEITVYGLGAGDATLVGTNLIYTVNTAATVAASTPIYIEVGGLTTPPTAGSYTALITTKTAADATIDSGTSPAVVFGGSTTLVNVAVAQTLLFTNDTASFSLGVDPTNTKNQQKIVSLSVKTNAEHGYTLAVKDNTAGLVNADGTTIARVASAGTGSFPAVGFGFQIAVTAGTGTAPLTSNWYGFKAAAAQTVVYANDGPTGNDADALTMTNKVAVDFTQAAGIYTDTITYMVFPTY